MAKAHRKSSDYSSIDDLSLPRGATAAFYKDQNGPLLERCNSDSNLDLQSPQSWSSLSVDKTFFCLRGIGKTHDAKVRVEWDIKENVGAQDWIGLFHSGETDNSKFLDCKTRGSSGGATGAIIWDLDAVEHLFSEAETVICFKYISGNSENVLATSPLVTVTLAKNEKLSPSSQASGTSRNSMENALFSIKIEELHATNLKKGMFFNPDSYVKLQVLPHNQRDKIQKHHNREHRSSVVTNTANPSWESEKFNMEVLPSDLLEIEVKHKFSKSRPTMSRFLGRTTIPVQTIIERITSEQKPAHFSLELMRKGPSDNVSGLIAFKASLHLVLQNNDGLETLKSNNGLQRQTSLPNSLPRIDENTPRSSRIRHRHTDPGMNVAEVLNMPNVASGIREEAETISPSSSMKESKNKNIPSKPVADTKQQTYDSGTFLEITNEQTDACTNSGSSMQPSLENRMRSLETSNERTDACSRSEGGRQPTSETFMDSSDSGTSLSVVSSTENSGGSIPPSLVPPIREETEPVSGSSSTSNSTASAVAKKCDNGSKNSIADMPNGQIASGGCGKESFNQGLDMSVQSAGLFFLTSISLSDAPTLPPRTYKDIAPPLPPRVFPTQAPPIPPRGETSKKRKPPGPSLPIGAEHTRATLEPPPPLPPRTYSPVEGVDMSDSEHHHGANVSSGRELFPWGSPVSPSSPGVSNIAHSQSPQTLSPTSHSLTSHHSPASNSRQTQHISEHLALVPPMENAHAAAQPGHMLPRRMDSAPGSRGSVALSTVSEPAGSSLAPFHTDPSHLKRRSIDGLPQLNPPIAPRIHPRQHRLSNEERQQINENLEQWTRIRRENNPPAASPCDQSSPPSFTECEQMEADEHLSPLPPPLPPSVSPAGASSHRSDSVDGQAASSHSPGHRNIAQPEVPTPSLNGPVTAPSPSRARERSGDRRLQDSGDPPCITSKRHTKYHRVDDRDDALPAGWEARVDSHGRIFYIDHVNRTTTWQRPQTGLQTVQRRPTLSSEQRQQLDRRYQSIRRTINQSQPVDTENVSSGESREVTTGASNIADNSPSSASPSDRAAERSERSVYKFPAVKFLTRPDFFPMLQANENAMVDYNRNSKLKHMITKIRRDPKTFERYHHNRDLVSFVNLFSDPNKELHRRWEMKYDGSGKPFFIDHVLRTTTFMDPRLPTDVPLINTDFLPPPAPRPRRNQESSQLDLPVPPPRDPIPENTAAIPTAYNEKVVLFLRQPNVDDVLRERSPQYASSSSLREKVNKIAARGVDMLERFSNDIELTLLLSLFENEIMSYVPRSAVPSTSQVSPAQRLGRVPAPYKRDFQAKLRNFYRKLESKGYGQGPGKLKLTVRRDHVLEDAFNKIMSTPKKELQKNKLYITFAGEEGLDYGGPSREFFFLLSRELFNPYYGLFEYSANDTYTVQVSPLSTFVENAHEWFRFSGRVLGLALVHQYLLDAFFTRPFYKALLGVPLSLEDVESLDMEFHQSLLWIKDNDINEVDLDLTFSVSEEVFGQVTERELKPNGKNISVTERNKKEYIEKMVNWRLERGVTEQTKSLIGGFHEVLDARLVATFDARELELVIAGTVEIDISDWRRNTDYRSGYHDQHPVIQWFWEAIEKFDNERQLRLLQFVTGSSSIPYEGFSALRGSNGPRKFCIEKWGKITSLPRAHTCFNRIDLPPYTSSEMLFEKLVMAVEETSTFGID